MEAKELESLTPCTSSLPRFKISVEFDDNTSNKQMDGSFKPSKTALTWNKLEKNLRIFQMVLRVFFDTQIVAQFSRICNLLAAFFKDNECTFTPVFFEVLTSTAARKWAKKIRPFGGFNAAYSQTGFPTLFFVFVIIFSLSVICGLQNRSANCRTFAIPSLRFPQRATSETKTLSKHPYPPLWPVRAN